MKHSKHLNGMSFNSSRHPVTLTALSYYNSGVTFTLKIFLFHFLIISSLCQVPLCEQMNRISACSHYFQKLSTIHHNEVYGYYLNKQCVSTICLYREGGRESVKHISVCFHIKTERRANLFGTLVPFHHKTRDGILPLVLCKRKLCCWSVDLGVTLWTGGCLSCVCQWKNNLSSLADQFYWLIERFFVAQMFVLFLVLCLRSRGTHTATHAWTAIRAWSHTFLHSAFSPWVNTWAW